MGAMLKRLPVKWFIPVAFVLWIFFVLASFFAVQKPFSAENFIAVGNALLDLLSAGWLMLIGLGLGLWLLRWLAATDASSQKIDPVSQVGVKNYSFSFLWSADSGWILPPIEMFVLGTGLGLGGLGLLGLGLGLLRLFQPVVMVGITIVLSVIAAPQLLQFYRRLRRWRSTNLPNRWIVAYLSISGLLALLIALTPPTDWDGLFYHLTGPKLYLETGQITGGFDVPHFNFPSLMEMLFAWAMLLRGDIAAKLIHAGYALLLAGLVYIASRRLFSPKAAWPSLLIFAGMPMVGTLAGWAYNDLALAFYQLATVYAIGNWRMENGEWRMENDNTQNSAKGTQAIPKTQNSKPKIQNLHWLILSGVFAGLAMGLKYTSFVTPLVIVGFILWSGFRRAEEQGNRGAEEQGRFLTPHSSLFSLHPSRNTQYAIGGIFIFSLTTFFTASPWYLKNWAFTGNPVYPFLSSVFGGQFWDTFRAEWYAAAGSGIGWRPTTLLALPWLLTLGIRDANFWDGRTGPLLLLFLPPILLYSVYPHFLTQNSKLKTQNSNKERPFAYNLLLIYALAHFAFWTLGVIWSRSLWQSRLLLPGLVGLVPLAGWVWVNLPAFDLPNFSISRFVNIAVGLALILTLVDTTLLTLKINPIPYLVGLETRAENLTRRLGAHYAAMQQINTQLPAEAKILFLWEPRSYYCRRDCRPDSILDTFPHLVYRYGSAGAIAQSWREAGVSHVLIHRAGLNFILNDSPETVDQAVLRQLESQYLDELFDVAGAYQVYAVRSRP
jgi:hypothetical protein